MLNCMLKDGVGVVAASGDMPEIMMDMVILVKHIHEGLNNDDKYVFKKFCEELLPELPFQDAEELAETEQEMKKRAENAKNGLDGLEKTLKEIRDILNDMGEE